MLDEVRFAYLLKVHPIWRRDIFYYKTLAIRFL